MKLEFVTNWADIRNKASFPQYSGIWDGRILTSSVAEKIAKMHTSYPARNAEWYKAPYITILRSCAFGVVLSSWIYLYYILWVYFLNLCFFLFYSVRDEPNRYVRLPGRGQVEARPKAAWVAAEDGPNEISPRARAANRSQYIASSYPICPRIFESALIWRYKELYM